jgi:hypothetical protein
MLMLALDAHQALRRLLSRTMLRVTAIMLAVGLLLMVFSSLFALRQITHSVESLMVDSMVGLESAVAMRSAVRESQLQVLRGQANNNHRLLKAEVETFAQEFEELLGEYRAGLFDGQDERNVSIIERKFTDYQQALLPLVDIASPSSEAFGEADQAARSLIDAVEQAYQFNRAKVRTLAQDASDTAGRALQTSNRLWGSLGAFAMCFLLIYLAYRWLALPETAND